MQLSGENACPLNGKGLTESLVYKAALIAGHEQFYYVGMTKGPFKHRNNGHASLLCIAGRGYGRSDTIQLLTPNHGGYEYIIVSNQYNCNSIYNKLKELFEGKRVGFDD